ncbi:MAG: twin-arginine translocation signal domain-containing protein, partial [Ginsengibacter sp.]
MSDYDSNRRKFVKFSAAGIGGLALSPFAGVSKEHL